MIGDDFGKEDQPEWNWVPHGDGWALMQRRCSQPHGLNKLTVRPDGFDWGGEEMRTLIAKLLNEHAEKTRAERSAVERLAGMLHEPLVLPPECPPLGERLIGAIDMLYREIHSLKESECDLLLLQRAWAPVVRAALAWRRTREREVFPELADSVDGLTDEQREAAEP
jgi:hypothetical protein